MKKMLLLLLIAICGMGLRSETLMQQLGWTGRLPQGPVSMQPPEERTVPAGMSLTQFADLAKTDPEAYRKLMQSHLQAEERSAVDKLMNFFAHLKYE